NPGHYVAEVVRPVATAPAATAATASAPAARRRLKLLRPDDTLVLGGVYRLVTFEDVLKQFVSKRNATMSRATIATAAEDDDGHRRQGHRGGEAAAAAPAKVAAQSRQENPSSPSPTDEARPEPEPEPEPDLVATAMALGGRMSLSRHGQWRPALPSIAEGSVLCF
ncbi:Os10g0352000, partial [Oryza sativa Japonica Group]